MGEIGLDYHYDFAPRQVQQAVFRAQLQVARARRLPVVIHTREAEADTLDILGESGARSQTTGVFHCFSGDAAAATRALADRLLLVDPRHRVVSEGSGTARGGEPRSRWIGCWSRPTVPTWRRRRIAASATSRRSWREVVDVVADTRADGPGATDGRGDRFANASAGSSDRKQPQSSALQGVTGIDRVDTSARLW